MKNKIPNPNEITQVIYNNQLQIISVKDSVQNSFDTELLNLDYQNEEIRRIEYFMNSRLIFVLLYHPNGKIAEAVQMNENRNKHGKCFTYDENAQVLTTTKYLNGKKHGKSFNYNPKLTGFEDEYIFKNGNLVCKKHRVKLIKNLKKFKDLTLKKQSDNLYKKIKG